MAFNGRFVAPSKRLVTWALFKWKCWRITLRNNLVSQIVNIITSSLAFFGDRDGWYSDQFTGCAVRHKYRIILQRCPSKGLRVDKAACLPLKYQTQCLADVIEKFPNHKNNLKDVLMLRI